MLMKHGSEGGFLATPAFTSEKADSNLPSRLIHLDRHGELYCDANVVMSVSQTYWMCICRASLPE